MQSESTRHITIPWLFAPVGIVGSLGDIWHAVTLATQLVKCILLAKKSPGHAIPFTMFCAIVAPPLVQQTGVAPLQSAGLAQPQSM